MHISSIVNRASWWIIAVILLIVGCGVKTNVGPQELAIKSEKYYQEALTGYKNEIAKGQNVDQLNLSLGRLYLDHGEFIEAAECFAMSSLPQAKKFLGVSFYRKAEFTDALEVFDKIDNPDDECLYYKGLTCEKMNLFDPALTAYKKIKGKEFVSLAIERIEAIERLAVGRNIKELSPESYRAIVNAPSEELYPQAGALILSCDESIEETWENTEVSRVHYLIKILNERGKEDFSEAKFEYDSTYEKIELEYARTIKPDGTVVDVGARHIRDVSKYLNFPLYSNARVFIISFPEIAEGVSVEYKLKVYRNQLVNKKDYVIPYTLQSTDPIISADFTVSFPKDNPANLKIINERYNTFGAKLTPEKEEKDGIVTLRWKFKNIPQIISEADMSPAVEITPTVLLSSFKDWQELYNWWWKLAKDKIQADTAIKDKVQQLIRGLKTDEKKARSIYNFCAKDIRYVAVEYGQAGFEPHQAADIFRNKYGDCKDQAILLVTMLKYAGFKAWPVLIPTKDCYNLNPDFPAMNFNHCIASVLLNDKIIFLDPTAETCSFGDLPAGDQARTVFICQEDKYRIETTPLYESKHNLVRQSTRISINDDENLLADKDIFTYGIYDQGQRYWLLYTQPELIKAQLKERIQEFSIGATLKDYAIANLNDLNKPVELKYSFSGPEYFTVAGSLRLMPQLASLDTALVAKDKRVYPLDFGILDEKEAVFEIAVPKAYAAKFIPGNISEDSSWLSVNVAYSFKNNLLSFKQNTVFKKQVILESEYSEFKKFYEGLAKKIKQRVVFEKVI
ncbi:MAG: DUF3857 and transglutaminase domain-containing protein [Candidatus Omnitrophica bacterium]|nr:DUF3857 and transglutaminase domain-containing protein [Candidatus Omnitrophota bacterium]